ncbi:hypothetical protein K504DRAFT_460147 [Pleomassaria siparia CBS 279.74]|uniref:Uncharacterized protein n=1 Tax=Pleomassaria siparia CBS 279.74 TaxID=1314801 RepID=A0A6G1K0S6_9PLEO|nr:hypothetical protein K504DRAFT_460147 [Pleomassaria siparia CBS 279.74]
MPTKSQSPGPTTSLPKLARSRKATFEEGVTVGRSGSAGGIILSREQSGVGKTMSSATTATKVATPPLSKDATATGPTRQRRRPRKLNKEPVSQSSTTPTAKSTTTASNSTTPAPASSLGDPLLPVSTLELEALKSRVRGLEAKVEELYNSSTETRTARSPRRRGKARKGSSATQVPTLSRSNTAGETGAVVEEEEEADEELVRLEGELEVARQDLEAYRPRTRPRVRTRRSASAEDEDDVEEIPRDGFPSTEDPKAPVNTGDRQVTLTGNYRIPLPSSVSMTDVKTIQSGVSAAQNVAKSFMEQRRAQAQLKTPTSPKTSAPATKKGKAAASTAVSTETNTGEGGKSWAEWVGGYSMAITRAVKTIEAEAAAIESQKPAPKRPTTQAKSTTGQGKTPSAKTTNPRPPLKPRAGNLSSEKVQGLMK